MNADALTIFGGARFTVSVRDGQVELSCSRLIGKAAADGADATDLAETFACVFLYCNPLICSTDISKEGRISCVPSEKWYDGLAKAFSDEAEARRFLRFDVPNRGPVKADVSDTAFLVDFMSDKMECMKGKGRGAEVMTALAGIFSLEFSGRAEGPRRTERFAGGFTRALYQAYLRGEQMKPQRLAAASAVLKRLQELYL